MNAQEYDGIPTCFPLSWRGKGMATTLNQEVLSHLELRVLTVARTVAGRWWNFHQVISPYSRLWLILDGRATVRHHNRQFALTPGKIHLVPPFTRHDCHCTRQFNHYYLHFVSRLQTGVDLLSLLDHEFELAAVPDALKQFQRLETLYPNRKLPCFDPSQEEYRRQPLAAEQADRTIPAVDWFEAKGVLISLLTPFLRTAREHPGVHARATQQFLAVQEFIHAHMARNILLGDLARIAKLHPTYFSDRFQKLVGVRPLEYLMQRRMERAQYLLLTSPAPVKEIAAAVGIPDAAYFTRAFARHCSCSPSDYRAAHSL
ncbi:MAG: AraC family transcriptional regulator [Verrucomicrobiota bacterium]